MNRHICNVKPDDVAIDKLLAQFEIDYPSVTQLTNVQSTKSEAAVTVRKKSVSCFTPTCVNKLKTCIFFSRFVLGITVFER